MSGHVLITGATKGIGLACAEHFATRGWRVTAVARSEKDLAQLAQAFPCRRIIPVVADLATEAGIADVPSQFYDVVVLNAAAFLAGGLLSEQDVFRTLWKVNVEANHLLARRLLPFMQQNCKGHLVVIGSLGTDYWPAHLTAYVATKFALRGLFQGWASELADSGVRATLVAPGATLTSSWADEIPPPDILAPERVAEVIWEVVRDGKQGRVTVSE